MLIKTIKDELPKSGLKKPYFKHNINGWSYRGLWMKPRIDETEEEIPEGSFPFTFKIDLFEHPEYLRFESDEGTRVLDLETNYFFNLAEDHQRKTLEQFLEQCRLVEQVKELI